MALSFDALLGLPDTARRAAALFVAMGRNRLELFSLECREEAVFSLKVLLVLLAALFFCLSGILLATAAIIFALPAEDRLAGLACCAGLYFLGSLCCALWAKALFARHPQPFAQSLQELLKDRQRLEKP